MLSLAFCLQAQTKKSNDSTDFYLIGFSKGGSYFAYEEYGTSDDAGNHFGNSLLYILKVGENSFAIPPFDPNGVSEKDGEYYVRRTYGRRAKRILKRFGIVGNNLGAGFSAALGVLDPDGDNSVASPRNGKTLPKKMKFTNRPELLDSYGDFEVSITPVLLPQAKCNSNEREMFSFEITLKGKKDKSETLQKTGDGLKKFGCADAFGIELISAYKNNFAVLIAGFTRGSKGPDNRYMVVTGVLAGR